MRVKKTMKKITALGMAGSMIGAGMLGAAAADLSNYPAMFVEGGKFDGVIAVGDSAIAADTIGALDITIGLQGGSGSDRSVVLGEGSLISSGGNDLNINETFFDVDDQLDDSDLPVILAIEEFDESEGDNDNEEEYDQEITFLGGDGYNQLVVDQDDDEASEGGLYIWTQTGNVVYNYTLDFDEEVDYDNSSESTANDDWETAKIKIQGNLYTITDVGLDSSNNIDEITLQAGDTTVWLEEGVTITRAIGGEEREVTLVNINAADEDDGESKCGVEVDGELAWIDVGSSEEVSGVEVGVTDAIAVRTQDEDSDVCEVNLGAIEVILKEGDDVRINGVDVDGSEVQFHESTGGEFDGFSIWYEADDDVYLAVGDTWVDPVLGNFEFNFANVNALKADRDMVTLDVSSDDLTMNFYNSEGEKGTIPFFVNDTDDATSAIFVGDDSNVEDRYYFSGGFCDGGGSITECEGARFLVNDGDELRIVEVDDIDTNNNETTIKDVMDGSKKTTDDTVNAGAVSVETPSGADVTLTITTAGVLFGAGVFDITSDTIETWNEGLISFRGLSPNGTAINDTTGTDFIRTGNFTIILDESEGEVDASSGSELDSRHQYEFLVDIDNSDDEEFNVQVVNSNFTGEAEFGGVDVDENNDDDRIYYTDYGTRIVEDNQDKRHVEWNFPEEELFAEVFVSAVGANIQGATGDGIALESGVSAKLASEVSLGGQNTILVGGPCANELAAEFKGVSKSQCSSAAPQPNTAEIELKEIDGSIAMLVNGYDAIDTRRAARVLSNYQDYSLMGDRVVVTGTGFSDLDVSEYVAPVAAPAEEEEEAMEEEESSEEEQ